MRRTFCLLATLFAVHLQAQEATMKPDPAAHTVVVPYDGKLPPAGQKAKRYYLDRESFERLWKLAKENRQPEQAANANDQPAAAIHSAAYRTVVEEEQLVITARFEAGSRGRWAKLTLPKNETGAVFRDWKLDGKPSAVVNGELLLEQPGQHAVEVVIELKQARGWKKTRLELPASAASILSISLPATDGRPLIEGIEVLTEEQAAGVRVFSGVLRQPGVLDLTRSPRRPLANDAPPAAADTELIIGHTRGGAQSLLGTVMFSFPGTERAKFSLAVDAAWQIAGWSAQHEGAEVAVRHWSVREGNGRRVLDFELERPVPDMAQVTLHGTRPGSLGAQRTPVLEPQAAKGQQTLALLHDATLNLEPQPAPTQRRSDKPAGMNAAMSGGRGKVTEIYFHTPARQTLAYTVAPAEAKQECRVEYVFQLGEQKQEMMAAVTLKRELESWAQLRLGLPAGFEIQSVDSPALAGWRQEGDELFLQFNANAAANEARLLIYLARSAAQPQTRWRIQPLRFTGFAKNEGTALIVAHAATEARLVNFTAEPGLQEADPAKVSEVFAITPPQEKKRALRFERGDWAAEVDLTRQPVRFSSDGIVLAQARDLGLLVSQQVAFQVEQGALSRVTVRLPAALPEAVVKGEALREVNTKVVGALREYDCSFQSDVLGRAALTFDMELPLAGELSLPLVEVAGAERLRRFFVLDNSSSRESRVVEAAGVETCAKNALPYLPDVLSQPAFYRATGSGAGTLRVAYQQLQATEGNSAIVTLADITSVWRGDGERWDTVVYSVFNRSLQFLPVILPTGAELIAVSVSGEAVRADQEPRADGRLVRLIPLIQTRAGQRSLDVRLIYRIKGASDGLKKGARLRMDDPELAGISAERTVWTAIVPRRFAIASIEGNMEEVAEESKVVERLQGLMSDFSRLNKVLASRSNVLSKEEGEYTIKEAEKLAKQIEAESAKVERLSKSNSSRTSKGAETKGMVLQQQVDKDISGLNDELMRQNGILSENRIQAPVLTNTNRGRVIVGNNWAMNGQAIDLNLEAKTADFDGFINYGKPIQAGAVDALGAPAAVALNDNTIVQPQFLKQQMPVQQEQAGVAGTLSGTGGVTIAKAGSGALTLAGTVAYTGATVINGGTLTLTREASQPSLGGKSGATLTMDGTSMTLGGLVGSSGATALPLAQNQISSQLPISGNARANVFNNQAQVIQGRRSGVLSKDGGDMAGGRSPAKRDAIDALTAVPQLMSEADRKLLPPAPATAAAAPAPAPAPADPFAAPVVPETPATSATGEATAKPVTRGDEAKLREPAAAFDPPQIQQSFGLEAQVASQLRATGRRSLMIDVPAEGTAYHFRKLKDHAVLELKLRPAWSDEERATAIWLLVGLAGWGLLSFVARRRRV